ncbi:ATP-grasp domain-containing protein [Streptomyces sp. TRM76323]|uniref:ATP-grasp domain-containing protein n=1 Tax=Streptomyces tamarix TaxID=3078565 RepID=A0ABU3QL00_9ACTN|nr:ATP-grasp domain-containing protein [Streptomyces tamarix]MDT9683062.1 ATP-grasp domain-containing protein [Streptomyces tamarix]
MPESRVLLMIAASQNPDLLRTPHEMGLEVVLAAATPPADDSLYDVHLAVDEFDEEAVLAAVRGHLARDGRVDAVATFHEGSLHVAARVAAELGLPGNSPEAVRAMRDKFLTGQRLTEAKVPTPGTRVATTFAEAQEAAAELGFPLVLKPQASASSQGVTKVSDETELKAAFDNITGLFEPDAFHDGAYSVPNVAHIYAYPQADGVLIQEYVSGEEFAVDLVYGGGEYRLLAIHDKPYPFAEPHFIEGAYATPSALSRDEQALLLDTAVAALKALGATVGGAHVELRLTDGGPKIIEVNGRLGGTTAFVQESIRESTGVWGPREYLRAVLGEPLDFTAKEQPTPAGFSPLLADRSGEIAGFTGVEEVMEIPGVIGVRWMAKPGDHVVIKYPENPVSCFALILARGESREQVLSALEGAEKVLKPVYTD